MNDNISRSKIFREKMRQGALKRKEESEKNPQVIRGKKPFYTCRGVSLPKEENIEK